MKKRKIYSPYYDFTTFQCTNPYEKTSPGKKEVSSRGKKHSSSEEKIRHNAKEEFVGDGGLIEYKNDPKASFEDFSDYRDLNLASKACQVNLATKSPPGPRRVSSQNFCPLKQQLLNKKVRDSQATLRYLLKLSNNTFHATLQHEIEMMKKEKVLMQDELGLHSQSIIKILKSQNENRETIQTIMARNQKLEDEIKEKDSILNNLMQEVREIRSKISTRSNLSDDDIEVILKRMKQSQRKMRNSHRPVSRKTCVLKQDPKSAPSVIPRRQKEKKCVRVTSEPAILPFQSGDSRGLLSLGPKTSSNSSYSTNYSNLPSELNLSCKNISSGSSIPNYQKTVGTNYSANDFG